MGAKSLPGSAMHHPLPPQIRTCTCICTHTCTHIYTRLLHLTSSVAESACLKYIIAQTQVLGGTFWTQIQLAANIEKLRQLIWLPSCGLLVYNLT